MIVLEAIRRATGAWESTIRDREMIGKWLISLPTPGTFVIQRNGRSTVRNSIITLWAKRKPFCTKTIVPSRWQGRRETRACWPKWFIAPHRPLPTCSPGTVWPSGHTTKRPYLSYNLKTPTLNLQPIKTKNHHKHAAPLSRTIYKNMWFINSKPLCFSKYQLQPWSSGSWPLWLFRTLKSRRAGGEFAQIHHLRRKKRSLQREILKKKKKTQRNQPEEAQVDKLGNIDKKNYYADVLWSATEVYKSRKH